MDTVTKRWHGEHTNNSAIPYHNSGGGGQSVGVAHIWDLTKHGWSFGRLGDSFHHVKCVLRHRWYIASPND